MKQTNNLFNPTPLLKFGLYLSLTFLLFSSQPLSAQQISTSTSSKPKLNFWSIGYEGNAVFPRSKSGKPAYLQGVNLSFYLSNQLIISTSFKESRTMRAKNFPSNYQQGLEILFGAPPENKMTVITVGLGKIVPTNSKLVRFTFEGGLSVIKHAEAVYTELSRTPFTFFFGSSHRVNYPESTIGIGINLKTKFEFNWARWGGMGWLIEGNLNTEQSYISIGGFTHFGKIRRRLKS